jgi:hypothetical protein
MEAPTIQTPAEADDVLTNQTQFSGEEPLFENPPVLPVEVVPAQFGEKPPQSFLAKYGYFMVGGSILLMVLTFALRVYGPAKKMLQPQTVDQSAAASPPPVPDALRQRLNETITDFTNADPSAQSLSFPPVRMDLALDPPTR